MGYDLHLLLRPAQDFAKTARVVVMTVAQNNLVDLIQVDAKAIGVMGGGKAFSSVKQDSGVVHLYQDAQPPFTKEVTHTSGIFT
jgi:hypothetical protein